MGKCGVKKVTIRRMKYSSRISKYRIMWIFVFFDLPTETKLDRHRASKFRNTLKSDGFTMFQFSIYLRHCSSRENAKVHEKRVRGFMPPKGKVGILTITDKQFGMMEIFFGRKLKPTPRAPRQLEMF